MDFHRSGEVFLHYLQHMVSDNEKVASQALPFFDAIACSDWDVAKNISLYSRQTSNLDEEYKDDFFYIHFLMKFFFLRADTSESENILKHFQDNMGDRPDPRLDLCTSFLETDLSKFEESLNDMIFSYKDDCLKKLNDGLIPEEEWAINSALYVEGLALLKLAEELNIIPEETEYNLIPSLARFNDIPVYRPNDWRLEYS